MSVSSSVRPALEVFERQCFRDKVEHISMGFTEHLDTIMPLNRSVVCMSGELKVSVVASM